MVANRYFYLFTLGILFWVFLFLTVTWVINPYGVSPINITIERINKFKPKRLDIDRLIKPYEVWRFQPKTIFLGTSRFHQSIDPSVLDGTEYAPAYNASIPASYLGMNISYLEQYIKLNPNLKTVFVELFFWNFLGQGMEHHSISLFEYLKNTEKLFFSVDALWASIHTIFYNVVKNRPGYEIKSGGNLYYPPRHNTKSYDDFPAGIWDLHRQRNGITKLHMPAIDVVNEFIDLCKKNDIELIFLITPNHAYSDYYKDAINIWHVVEQWLLELTKKGAVIYNFSQANDWTYESVDNGMVYWNDPFHFSLEMGRMMQLSLLGLPINNRPEKFMNRMTPDKVESYIQNNKNAIKAWAENNPEFVEKFNIERAKWESDNDSN